MSVPTVRRAAVLLAVVVASLATVVVGGPATHAAVAPAMRMCVLASTHENAVKRGAELLDAAPQVDVRYRTVEHGCADGTTEVIVVDARKGATTWSALTHRDRSGDWWDVTFNLDKWRYTPRESTVIALHELMHVVVRHRGGAGWDELGHTSRCD
ncbi:MAG: hypothetical protein ACRDMV_19635, partial [Streptosporangiales bacterium]